MNIDLNRTVGWIGSVDEENFKKVSGDIGRLMKKSKKKPIYLIVNSGGGSTAAGFGFYDMMMLFKPNLVTIGTGDVSSIAIIVWLAGKKRFLTKHCSLFFHEIGRTFKGSSRYDTTEIRSVHENLTTDENFYAAIVAASSRGRLSKKQVIELLQKEKTLLPEEVRALGLAHAIV